MANAILPKSSLAQLLTKTSWRIIGLMSGTSVDAVDACLIEVEACPQIGQAHQWKILATHTHPMPASFKVKLKSLMGPSVQVTLSDLLALDAQVGELFAATVLDLLDAHQLAAKDIDALASHGQTIAHFPTPQAGASCGTTLQIGSPSLIANKTGITTVADFRVADMAVGGQGAPLVPYADQLLLRTPSANRLMVNIGGISNGTVLPKDLTRSLTAFDFGPGNMLMDALIQQESGQPYDKGGELAASGQVHTELLAWLMSHPFLQAPPPKSTGHEAFGLAFLKTFEAKAREFSSTLTLADKLATLSMFTVTCIVEALDRWIWKNCPVEEVIIGGGGAENTTLMNHLQAALNTLATQKGVAGITLKTHADFGIPNAYKEALAFALLGWACLAGIPANVPSCTGATRPAILGTITQVH